MPGALGSYNWLASHGSEADKYAGKWVAVVEGRVLGAADSVKELLKLPEVKAANKPLVTKIPRQEEADSVLKAE